MVANVGAASVPRILLDHCSRDTKVPPTLCLDERRRNVFGRPNIDAAAKFAVANAIKEINQ